MNKKLESISKLKENRIDNLNEISGGGTVKSHDVITGKVYDKNVYNSEGCVVKHVDRAWYSNSGKREVTIYAGDCYEATITYVNETFSYTPDYGGTKIDQNY
jgi:hypothetical protein